jgi:preprotein translocase SecE subunit
MEKINQITDNIKKFLNEVWAEVSPKKGKVSWPTKKMILVSTGVVIVCVAIVTTYIWIIDAVSLALLNIVIGR